MQGGIIIYIRLLYSGEQVKSRFVRGLEDGDQGRS